MDAPMKSRRVIVCQSMIKSMGYLLVNHNTINLLRFKINESNTFLKKTINNWISILNRLFYPFSQ